MNRMNLAMLTAASVLAACAAAAQPPPPGSEAVQIKATDLGHRTWMLEGQGGNITVIAGDDGVIMVDSQFAPLHDKIKAAVAKLSPQPIRYVVNTISMATTPAVTRGSGWMEPPSWPRRTWPRAWPSPPPTRSPAP
mgnify:CR=1 FL=1